MHQKNKFNFFIIFIFFIQSLFAIGFEEKIEYINQSRTELWNDFLLILLSEDTEKIKDVKLISDDGNIVYISQNYARKLLSIDSFGRLNRVDNSHRGHHPVVKVNNVFIKSDTVLPHLDPMMETAVFLFHSLLFKEGVVPSRFAFLSNVKIKQFSNDKKWDFKILKALNDENEEFFIKQNPEYESYLVDVPQNHLMQLSKAISGQSGKNFIEQVDLKEKDLSLINIIEFQKHFISSLLIKPGDNKTENFIITNDNRIIFIDNDLAFHHTAIIKDINGLYSETQPFAGCKNILFLLTPLSKKSIDSEIINIFEKIEPQKFLKTWLDLTNSINKKIQNAIPSNILNSRYKNNFLPFCLEKNTISKLLTDMNFLKDKITLNKNCISCDALFHDLYPDLATYYDEILEQNNNKYLPSLKKLYSNEIPYIDEQKTKKLGISAFKGRWIFNKITEFKNRRTQSIYESYIEIEKFEGNNFNNTSTKDNPFKEFLLKNCDNSSFRNLISDDILNCLKNNSLPDEMLKIYPYKSLESQLECNFINDCPSLASLKTFLLKQQVYEDFIEYFFNENRELLSGMNTIQESLKKISSK